MRNTGDVGTALERLRVSTWGSADKTQPCQCGPRNGPEPGCALEMGRETAAGGDGVSKAMEVDLGRACKNAGVTLAEVRLGDRQAQGLVRMWGTPSAAAGEPQGLLSGAQWWG